METNAFGAVTDIYLRGINLLAWLNQATGVTEYYSYNAHGDVTQLTDSTGKVVKEYRYDAFGNEITSDAASGVVTTGTFGYFSNGAQKVSMKSPGSTVSAETLVIPPGSNVGANTPYMALKQNTAYVLEFDYWGAVDGDILITDLYPDTLPESHVTVAKTLQHAIVTISSACADMSSAELRFFINGGYGHVNTGSVYVTNIRFYKQGASQAAYMYKGQYFDAGSGLDTTYFTAFWNAASNTIKAVPGQTGTTNVLTLKGSLTACALTAPMVLSLNTDYVVEFDYWSDGDGNTLKTDLYSSVTLASVTPQMSLPATTAGVVQHGTVTFNSANVNMASAELRFFYNGSNTYNVYVANVRFYNKAVYTSGQFLDINSAVKTNAFVNFWIYATNTVMTPPWTTVSMNVLTIKPATASTAFTAPMALKTNTTYVVEFDYWSAGTTANEQIVTDLYSSVWGNSLTTQVHSAATTKLKHMKLTFTSTNANMNTAQLRFFYSGGSTADVYVANVLFYEDGTAGTVGVDGNKFRYASMYWDGETWTYYDLARFYNPKTGRFTQEDTHWNVNNMIYGDNPALLRQYKDPLGLDAYTYAPSLAAMRQCNNLYAYCMSNPLHYVDPSGNMDITPDQLDEMYNEFKLAWPEISMDLSKFWQWVCLANQVGADNIDRCIGAANDAMHKAFAWVKDEVNNMFYPDSGGGGTASGPDPNMNPKGPKYKAINVDNFKYNLQQFTGDVGDGCQAHHVLPQAFRDKFAALGLNIDDPLYGAWVNKNLHSNFSYDYNQDWQSFFDSFVTRKPTIDEILAFARAISYKYGYNVNF